MAEKVPEYTVDEALRAVGFGKFQWLVLVYTGMGWISDAMEMMILSFVGPAVKSEWNLSSNQESLISTVVFFGLLIGSYSWGYVSDKFGRRRGFLITAIVTSLAGLLSAFAPSYIWLIIARCVVGVGLGGVPVLLSYFLEFVPAPKRGFWMMVFYAFWTVGTISEGALAWIVMPRLGWRWLLGLSAVPSFILLLFYIVTPESPRYLCLKGRKDDAIKIMEKMAKLNEKPLPPGVLATDHELDVQGNGHLAEVAQLSSHGRNENINSPPPKLKESDLGPLKMVLVLLSRKLLRSTLLIWVVFFANAFSYYGFVLLTSELNNGDNKCYHGQSQSQSSGGVNYRDVFITSFAEFPGIILAAILIDKIGRKFTMMAMFLVCCVVMLPLVAHQSSTVTLVLLFGARICVTGTFAIIYIYAPELYPTSVRTTGVGLASSMGRIGGMVCPLVAVSLVRHCHQAVAVALFVGVIFVAGICTIFFQYDTMGRDLMERMPAAQNEEQKDVKQQEVP